MPNKGDHSILVIEDNPGDFTLVEEFLFEQIEGPLISHASNYTDAKKILSARQAPFDIVLLDLSLPDKTGMPLIQGIVELSLNAPVIVLTGYADLAFGVQSLSLGVSDYLLKDELTSMSLYRSIVYNLERKRIVSELAESERRYSELFHLSPIPMYVFELESLAFLDVNDAFIKYYGYTREEIFNMNMLQIRPEEELTFFKKKLSSDSKDQKNSNIGIHKHLKKSGEVIQVDIQSNFIEYQGKKAKITVAVDVTERLNYIKAIEAQNEKLREISWIQSHVVRAPLARIMGLIHVIREMRENSEEKETTLDYIILSANELDDAIKIITHKTNIDEGASEDLKGYDK
jgi:PAS domain S-box-containing protein